MPYKCVGLVIQSSLWVYTHWGCRKWLLSEICQMGHVNDKLIHSLRNLGHDFTPPPLLQLSKSIRFMLNKNLHRSCKHIMLSVKNTANQITVLNFKQTRNRQHFVCCTYALYDNPLLDFLIFDLNSMVLLFPIHLNTFHFT